MLNGRGTRQRGAISCRNTHLERQVDKIGIEEQCVLLKMMEYRAIWICTKY